MDYFTRQLLLMIKPHVCSLKNETLEKQRRIIQDCRSTLPTNLVATSSLMEKLDIEFDDMRYLLVEKIGRPVEDHLREFVPGFDIHQVLLQIKSAVCLLKNENLVKLRQIEQDCWFAFRTNPPAILSLLLDKLDVEFDNISYLLEEVHRIILEALYEGDDPPDPGQAGNPLGPSPHPLST